MLVVDPLLIGPAAQAGKAAEKAALMGIVADVTGAAAPKKGR